MIKKFKIDKIYVIVLFILSLITAYGYLRGKSLWQLVIFILTVPLYTYSKYIVNRFKLYLKKYSTKYLIGKALLCFILSFCIYVSFAKQPYGQGKLAIISNIGYIISLFIGLFLLSESIAKLKIKSKPVKLKWWELLCFMIVPLVGGTIALLGVYPGGMSPDSVVIWDYITKSIYNNAHPLLYLLLVKGLSLIWNSPAIVTIFQIILSSFTYAYIAYRLKEIGLNTILCYAGILVMTILPANLMINIIIWKDIPYTMSLLIVSVEVLRMFTNKEYFSKINNLIPIMVASFFVMASRHNGKYVIILFFVILAVFFLIKKYYRHSIKVVSILVAVIILFTGIFNLSVLLLGDRFEKNDHFTSSAIFAIPIQGLVTIYNTKYDELNIKQKEYLYKYLDIEGLKAHTEKYDFEYWRFQGSAKVTANAEAINKDKKDFINAYLVFFRLYPRTIIGAYMKSTAIAWSSLQYGFTSTYVVDVCVMDDPNIIVLEQNVISPKIKNILRDIGETAYDFTTNMLYWRPAFVMLLILLLILSSKNRFATIFISLPLILNHLSYFASCEGQCTRYMYGNYCLFILVLFYVLLNKNNIYNNNNKVDGIN